MKKLINLIALVMLVSTNVLTPFSYAQVETPELIPESGVEMVTEGAGESEKILENNEEILENNEETPEVNLEEKEELDQENQEKEVSENVLPDIQDDVESPTIDENKDEDTEKSESDEVAQPVEENTENERQKEDLENNNKETIEQENLEDETQGLQKTQEINTMDTTNSMDIVIEATSTVANQTLKINKYFSNAYTVSRCDGCEKSTLSSDMGHTYEEPGTYTITLSLTGGATRWIFQGIIKPLVPINGTTMTGVKIISMPSLADGFGDGVTTPGNGFFLAFNYSGAITSLPAGSFDTSKITTVGKAFFNAFNYNGAITSLPAGSFDISNISGTVGNHFFTVFNDNGAITSLPAGSFDISKITTVEDHFFDSFNDKGAITSLPEGSFRLSTGLTIANDSFFEQFNHKGLLTALPSGSFNLNNITTVGDNFFAEFNDDGYLTNLPDGSFDTSNITSVGNLFFRGFNYSGAITSLPKGSFDISHIMTAGDDFFRLFNYSGAITSLPKGSFRLSTGLTTVGDYFFEQFNSLGQLTSLSSGSFNIENITTIGHSFFHGFNRGGALISLPEGSFRFSIGLLTGGDNFFKSFNQNGSLITLPDDSFNLSGLRLLGERAFYGFNYNGSLTSLPVWSFDTSNITKVGIEAFMNFNRDGTLTQLPEGSFDISNITEVGHDFFYGFNYNGSLTSLPTGSFDTSNVVLADEYVFGSFNRGGAITQIPDSFTMNSVLLSQDHGYRLAFNSPNYTINRKVSDLVSGVTVPLVDMNVFSDNQPGRCGVHENWLENPATACKTVIFETDSGSLVDSQVVDISVNEKIKEPIKPIKTGYAFDGRYSNEDLTEVFDFSTVITDDIVLYAKWKIRRYTIIFKDGDNEIMSITGDYGIGIIHPSNPTKNGYKFIGWEPKVPATIPAEDMTINAVWGKLGYSGGGGGGGSSKKTDEDTHGSAEDSQKNTQDNKNTENVIQSDPEHSEGGSEESSNTPVDSSDKSLEGQEILSPSDSSFTKEQKDAYIFAKENGITTKDTVESAQMDGKLTRIAMAKMLSQYAINVLGQAPDTSKTIKFKDVTSKKDADYDNGVTLAYQLGIMGQNMPNNRFRPNDEVSRAEFVTALSRLLYQTTDGEYKSTSKYYTPHMAKLYNEGIINNTDPSMKERRGYVMIMLMRSSK